jgi:hypothetical protein
LSNFQTDIATLTPEQKIEIAISTLVGRLNLAPKSTTVGDQVLQGIVDAGAGIARLASETITNDRNGSEIAVGDDVQDVNQAVYTIVGMRDFCRVLDCVPVGGGDAVTFAPGDVVLWAKANG